ncbi:hypothetical protein [Rhizobium tubonense]|uniref:hypothetical protein n=1 Tax=Rhizobium tubonense TaxID=484088 RepID=UPI001FCEDF37|nr:hypothetical protein [Rhizobium tubonense]
MSELEAPDVKVRQRDFSAFAGTPRAWPVAPIINATQATRTQENVALQFRLRLAALSSRAATACLLLEEAAYGRALLFAPVYIGSGAIAWFAASVDPPLAAIVAGFLIFSVSLLIQRRAGPALRHLLFAVC